MVDIAAVTAADFPRAWPLLAGHFEAFAELARGEETVAAMQAGVMTGHRQCWAAVLDGKIVGAALTQVTEPYRVVEVAYAHGGNGKAWAAPMWAAIEAWARDIGAKRMRIIGRQGWLRWLDVKVRAVVMEKDLG